MSRTMSPALLAPTPNILRAYDLSTVGTGTLPVDLGQQIGAE